jgi:RNA polymerase sigma factor (sigma-70 family)
MKDFRLDLKLRNNRILRRIEALGFRNVAQFCKAHDLHQSELGSLIGLKLSPFQQILVRERGVSGAVGSEPGVKWRLLALRLAEIFNCAPEDLFSEDILRQRAATRASLELDAAQAAALTSSVAEQLAIPPDVQFSRKELAAVIEQQLETLSEKEALVIRRRFGLDGDDEQTLEGIASGLGVTRERIRQIESRALRKLKYPARSSALAPYLDIS